MRTKRSLWWGGLVLLVAVSPACHLSAPDYSEYAEGPAPRRMPSPGKEDCTSYEDSLTGGKIFTMYCASCHNARILADRPFSSYQNVAAHMHVRADLTGKEYAKLLVFLRRWADVPPPHPLEEPPSPKRFVFSQPIPELRPEGDNPPAEGPAGAVNPER
jgi:hypothetical protein